MSEKQHTVPHTITYSDSSQTGALFLAGTFSKPEWMLQEMRRCNSCADLSTYSISVNVQPGKEYQYRFRRGREGEWTVDYDKPVVKSALGTKSNILRVSRHDSYASGAIDLPVPLLAHEQFGAYTLTDGSQDAEAGDLMLLLKKTAKKRENLPRSYYHDAPADLNDGTLESFPCDKSSILGTLRKIQSSLGDGDGFSAAQDDDGVRRHSFDSHDASGGSMSSGIHRRREGRLLGSSSGRSPSLASLGSIAEEPCSFSKTQELKMILLTDSGEALVMRSSNRQ